MALKRLDELPGNSENPRGSAKPAKLEAVVTSKAKTGKRRAPGGLSNDVRNIGNSLFTDIVIPAIREAVIDFFTNGISMILRGGDEPNPRGYGRGGYNYGRQYQQYRRPSDPIDRRYDRRQARMDDVEPVFEDVLFRNHRDAETVLGIMSNRVADWGWVTVGDLYNLAGLDQNVTHERYGWDDLSRCQIRYRKDGYVIDFPEPLFNNRR